MKCGPGPGILNSMRSPSAACCSAPSRLISPGGARSEEHTSELQSPCNLVCRPLLGKKTLRAPVNWQPLQETDCFLVAPQGLRKDGPPPCRYGNRSADRLAWFGTPEFRRPDSASTY